MLLPKGSSLKLLTRCPMDMRFSQIDPHDCRIRSVQYMSPFLLLFSLSHAAYGILVPRPGIKPVPPAVEVWSLNHQTAREAPMFLKYISDWFCFFELRLIEQVILMLFRLRSRVIE